MTSALGKLDKPAPYSLEPRRRQWPVTSALVVNSPNIRPRPNEEIALGQHDPGSLLIETQAALRGRWDLNRIAQIGG
jgi:hypothetical protein